MTTPTASERLTAKAQEFERYPKLAAWIEKFANNPLQSWASWCGFIGEINNALATARASNPVPVEEDEFVTRSLLSDLVHLQDEYEALSGGGPNWLARWNKALADAREEVRIEP